MAPLLSPSSPPSAELPPKGKPSSSPPSAAPQGEASSSPPSAAPKGKPPPHHPLRRPPRGSHPLLSPPLRHPTKIFIFLREPCIRGDQLPKETFFPCLPCVRGGVCDCKEQTEGLLCAMSFSRFAACAAAFGRLKQRNPQNTDLFSGGTSFTRGDCEKIGKIFGLGLDER